MPSIFNIATSIASKGIGAATTVGGFVAGQAVERVKSLTGGGGSDDTYSPVTPAPASRGGDTGTATNGSGNGAKVAELQPVPGKPGGTRMAPPAPKRAAKPRPASAPASPKSARGPKSGSTPATSSKASTSEAAAITQAPTTGGSRGETTTTTKSTSRTGARSAGGQITNPKKARAVRKRMAADAEKASGAATAKKSTGAKATAKATRGGRPESVKAENTPSERTSSGAGKEAAPLGTDDRS